MIVYSCVKVVAGVILTALSATRVCEWDLIDLWLMLVVANSGISIWCYLMLKRIMRDMVYIYKYSNI
jgi:hypothetical protein